MMKNYFILFIFSIFAIACSPKTSGTSSSGEETGSYADVETLAKNNFKGDYKVLSNSNDTYVAIYEVLEKPNIYGEPTTKILVYDVKAKSIIWGKNAENGKVAWDGKYKLSVDYTLEGKKYRVNYNPKTKQVTYVQ